MGIDKLFFKQPVPFWRNMLASLWMVGITYILAISIPSIGIVFGFVGATVGQLVIYVFPALYFIILEDNILTEENQPTSERLRTLATNSSADPMASTSHIASHRSFRQKYLTPKKIPAFLLIIAGIAFGVIGVYELIANPPPS